MANIEDCTTRAEQLLDAIMEISAMQHSIDDMLSRDYKEIPEGCVPELFRESEEAVGSCSLSGDESRDLAHKQRKMVKEKLNKLSDELRASSSQPGDDYDRLANVVKGEADLIDGDGITSVVALEGINEIIAANISKMFSEFNECVRG
ncbi:MAG: hypothetical protein ABSF21_00060 [Dehalococcoidia bacterium]|jgi:hypothetical protein